VLRLPLHFENARGVFRKIFNTHKSNFPTFKFVFFINLTRHFPQKWHLTIYDQLATRNSINVNELTMRKKTFQITIPEPCDQKWEDMTPQSKGRFCGQCTKTIVDFSGKTDREIAATLKASEGQLCGRFTNDQLNRDIILATTLKNNSQWKATGLMLSAMLTMSACDNRNTMTTGMIAPVEQFDIQEDKETTIEQITSEEIIIEEGIDYSDLDFVLGDISPEYAQTLKAEIRKSKYMFALSIALILGGILLFIFVLEMIVRATM